MRLIVALLVVVLVAQPCWAWSECGHNIIAMLAYDLLSKGDQQRLQTLLKAHPKFEQDFVLPANVAEAADRDRWLMGRAGYWPDVARAQPEFNRPNWHFQLGAALIIGRPNGVPQTPGPLPATATLETKELHIAQAVELCRGVLREKSHTDSERALAICWLAHLVADSHQPCHAGSLYVEGVFPEGDRGANSIPIKQGRNLHALWDGLLGDQFDAADIRRRAHQITADQSLWNAAATTAKAKDSLEPLVWLKESANDGVRYVYTPEVLSSVDAAARGLTKKVEAVDLTDVYLTNAGKLARQNAALAAHRLAGILKADLPAGR